MFTGLIETTGTLAATHERSEGRTSVIRAPEVAPELTLGESIAVDGCCLTVERVSGEAFEVFASPETLGRTTLAEKRPGSCVNLERSLALGDRLGGHLVTGHVDAMGVIESYESLGQSWRLVVRFPEEMAPLVVEKGSIAVNGISLTTFEVNDETFTVAIIPETHERTTLHLYARGDRVNLEADLIGKYVARMISHRIDTPSGRISEELLRQAGFMA